MVQENSRAAVKLLRVHRGSACSTRVAELMNAKLSLCLVNCAHNVNMQNIRAHELKSSLITRCAFTSYDTVGYNMKNVHRNS